ncbi:uncharacterized protein LOC110691292 [Chenopodium quinoa]|uniref:uncharacterized protein LOC110691292 n=1 Tax=Chenopodium quinoa TaxID=63459 RepID=UPI000B795127|nr:uncharacterized protein LOC110691292 [Chenopodium quinoa]
MGNMSINEYYNKFIELMRFTPEVVPTETIKAQRFEQGLTLILQGKLERVNFETLDEVYGHVAHLYGIKGREMEHSGEKRKNPYSFHGGEKRHKPNGNHQGNFGDRKDNKGYFGKGNGAEANWPMLEGMETKGKLGHREYECFKKEADIKAGKVKESSTSSKPSQPSRPTPKVETSSGAGGALKGRVFVMNSREAKTSNDVVIGVFLISSLSVKVLFDSSASHSFIPKTIVESLGLVSPKSLSLDLSIPSGEGRNCSKLFRSVPLWVEFASDLIEFDLKDLNVILGVDWLRKYKAKIDCAAEKVTLNSPNKTRVTYRKEGRSSRLRIISAMQL